MDDHSPEMSPEEERNSFGEEGEGASEGPSSVVTSEQRREVGEGGGDNSSLLGRMEGLVGRVGNLVQEVRDLREAEEPVVPPAGSEEEEPCPICGATGIFGVDEKWLYLLFAFLGFLMGYIASVHGRG